MAEETPAAPAPTGESVANNPTNTNTNEAPAEGVSKTETTTDTQSNSVDLHGFTSEQLGEMKKFFDNNGGFEKVKAKISNPDPKPAEPEKPQQPAQVPTNSPQPILDPNLVDINTLALEDYFDRISQKPEYAGISNEIKNGDILKEMGAMGMTPIIDSKVNIKQLKLFLDMKAKGMPAPQTSSEPEASPAPTVGYIPVGENIESKEQAYQVLQQNVQLKAMGQAEHPATAKAKEFLKGNWGK